MLQVDKILPIFTYQSTMKLISWNVRGINGPGKYRMLKNMILQEQLHIVFMQETKCSTSTLEPILSKAWAGCKTTIVDETGALGGLAIAWNSQHIYLTNIRSSHYFIQAMFHLIGTNIHGHLTNVYFPQESTQKIKQLKTLKILNAPRAYPL